MEENVVDNECSTDGTAAAVDAAVPAGAVESSAGEATHTASADSTPAQVIFSFFFNICM